MDDAASSSFFFSSADFASNTLRCAAIFVFTALNTLSLSVLRMPAHEGGAAHTGAGVRKPPMEETA